MTSNGVFFEFISYSSYLNDKMDILPLARIKVDEEYVILISTICGLLRYELGDVVRFTSCDPYRLHVVGRISDYINAFGEDLLLEQAERALLATASKYNVIIRNYTVAPSYITIDKKGYHDWYIEFEKEPEDLKIFSKKT